jgi:hypothetical protein
VEPLQVVGEQVQEPPDLVRVQTAEPHGELLAADLVRTPGVR